MSEVLVLQAASVRASRAAAASGATEPVAIRKGMNLTFPMALDYRHGNQKAPYSCRKVYLPTSLSGKPAMVGRAGSPPLRPIKMLSAIQSLFRKRTDTEPVYAVYSAIVAQSRQPRFYADWQVPDTVTGRFDMISLHMALLFRRLRGEKDGRKEFSQAVFDVFFKDMDRSLREMGVTDLGVPKKVEKMGSLFYGLLGAVSEVLDRNDEAGLVAVLERNVYAGTPYPGANALAAYLSA